MQQVIVLCPIYNDEASFAIFAHRLEKIAKEVPDHSFSFLLVNDGSYRSPALSVNLPLTIIHLHRNIGHQKAIAIGLAYAHHNLSFDKIIVMDCDGEDRPEDMLQLLKIPNTIVVAKRASRQEGIMFQLFYRGYKSVFFLLTGKRISFGNFMLLPRKDIDKIVYYSEIWNNLAGAILKSKIPYVSIATHRGKRYEGSSKMDFMALLLHGLGAIVVFIDIIASRLLMFSLFMIFLSVIAILVILFIKLFTQNAIPGWTTTAISSMLVVLLQSFLLSLFTVFLYLSFQGQRKFIPAHHYMDYVRSIKTSNEKEQSG